MAFRGRRVLIFGNSPSGAVPVTEERVSHNPAIYEDDSFVTGDSPVTIDLSGDIGERARSVTIWNSGSGSLQAEYSVDGASFSDPVVLPSRTQLSLDDVTIASVRLTWVSDTAYKVIAV